MPKKIEGLKKVKVLNGTITYEYRGVLINRYYRTGTVGRVGVYRGSAKYQTAGYNNTFMITDWNESKSRSDYFRWGSETLKEATARIDDILDNQNVIVAKGQIWRDFPEEKLIQRGVISNA